MALKSSSYSIKVSDIDKKRATSTKNRLLAKHGAEVGRVISEAKEYSESYKKILKQIASKPLSSRR